MRPATSAAKDDHLEAGKRPQLASGTHARLGGLYVNRHLGSVQRGEDIKRAVSRRYVARHSEAFRDERRGEGVSEHAVRGASECRENFDDFADEAKTLLSIQCTPIIRA